MDEHSRATISKELDAIEAPFDPEAVLAMYADAVRCLEAGLPIVSEEGRGMAMISLWHALAVSQAQVEALKQILY